jgi:hypothetical protein
VGCEGCLQGFGEAVGTMARFDDDWSKVGQNQCL